MYLRLIIIHGYFGGLGDGGYGGTVAFEKAPQNFYTGGGFEYSLCKSDCSPIWFRPVHEKIVRERLREHPHSTGRKLFLQYPAFYGE